MLVCCTRANLLFHLDLLPSMNVRCVVRTLNDIRIYPPTNVIIVAAQPLHEATSFVICVPLSYSQFWLRYIKLTWYCDDAFNWFGVVWCWLVLNGFCFNSFGIFGVLRSNANIWVCDERWHSTQSMNLLDNVQRNSNGPIADYTM